MIMTSETFKQSTSTQPQWSTLCVHGGEDGAAKARGAVTEPIFCSSTYAFADTQSLIDFIEKKLPREEYARYGNPTEKTVERKLAALEGAEDCVLYSTGMAAAAGLFLARLNGGDELIVFDELYQRTRELCEDELSRFGIVTRIVPTGDFASMEAAITPATRLLFCESPTNPQLSVVDLPRFAALGRKHGIETAVDSTMASPYNVRPLQFGIDYVLHSCTKYLSGHNDVLAGSVAGTKAKLDPLRKLRGYLGATNSPHAEYLLLRGLKTFELRMERHNANGQAVAEFLAAHPRIERVYYPGLPGHPNYETARRTMRGCAGVVTFTVKGADWKQTAQVVERASIAEDRRKPRRRGIARRAAVDFELLRVHAAKAGRMGNSRQHDPAFVRNRGRRRHHRQPAAGAGKVKDENCKMRIENLKSEI